MATAGYQLTEEDCQAQEQAERDGETYAPGVMEKHLARQWPYHCQLCGAGCPERYHEPHNDRMVCADCYTGEVGEPPDEEQGLHRIDRYIKEENLLISLTVGDVQEEAEHQIGRRLTDDQLRRVDKVLDYASEALMEAMQDGIRQATG